MIIEGLMMVLIIILAIKLWSCETRLDLINEEVEDWIADARELKQRSEGHKELIEALSKSVRELNGVVEAAVRVKEETSDNKPDAKALVSGWDADEPEPENPVKLQSNLLGQTQQCIYPWNPLQQFQLGQLQSSAMFTPQQCIYPWQQTQTGAILPLWYMNRDLEDM